MKSSALANPAPENKHIFCCEIDQAKQSSGWDQKWTQRAYLRSWPTSFVPTPAKFYPRSKSSSRMSVSVTAPVNRSDMTNHRIRHTSRRSLRGAVVMGSRAEIKNTDNSRGFEEESSCARPMELVVTFALRGRCGLHKRRIRFDVRDDGKKPDSI